MTPQFFWMATIVKGEELRVKSTRRTRPPQPTSPSAGARHLPYHAHDLRNDQPDLQDYGATKNLSKVILWCSDFCSRRFGKLHAPLPASNGTVIRPEFLRPFEGFIPKITREARCAQHCRLLKGFPRFDAVNTEIKSRRPDRISIGTGHHTGGRHAVRTQHVDIRLFAPIDPVFSGKSLSLGQSHQMNRAVFRKGFASARFLTARLAPQ